MKEIHYIFRSKTFNNILEDSMIKYEEVITIFKTLLSRLSNWEILVYYFQLNGYSVNDTALRLLSTKKEVNYTRSRVKTKLMYLVENGIYAKPSVKAMQFWW